MTPWLPPELGPGGSGRTDGRPQRLTPDNRPSGTQHIHGTTVPGAVETAGSSRGGQAAAGAMAATQETRAERIARVRQLIESGRPVDLAKLADTLLGTGILFDERT
jgi:anti-sigma28 factor (negative regulator of flagellin synthesis)